MWHTPDGDRSVTGAEADLIKAAVTDIVELVKDESSGHNEQRVYGIQLFDELTWSQRLVLLERVMTYLLTDTQETLELTAVNEAAVGAIFEHVVLKVDCEIDAFAEITHWRGLVLAAYESCVRGDVDHGCIPAGAGESDDETPFTPPGLDCDDKDQWRYLVESLTDRILWDRDYEMGSQFLDMSPEKSAIMKQLLGIDNDYYSLTAQQRGCFGASKT